MKMFLSALTMALVATPLAASAAQTQHTVTTVRERPNGTTVVRERTVVTRRDRAWRAGERFDYRTAPNYRRLSDYRSYRLRAPDRGFYWARSGRDAVLVRPNGTIVEVRSGLFR